MIEYKGYNIPETVQEAINVASRNSDGTFSTVPTIVLEKADKSAKINTMIPIESLETQDPAGSLKAIIDQFANTAYDMMGHRMV